MKKTQALTPAPALAALPRVIDHNKPQATKADLAEHFGVSERTINNWLADPDFPAFGRGLRLRFKISEVEAYRKQQKAARN